MLNWFPTIASFSGAFSVAMGAFGAHALKDSLNPHQYTSWNTATKYQLAHSVALLFASTARPLVGARLFACSGFSVGMLLFCGSIYGLCTLPQGHALRKVLGPTTPMGGLSFMAGWIALGISYMPVA